MQRKLNRAFAAALVLFGGAMMNFAQPLAFAAEATCMTTGTLGYCGVDSKCIRWWYSREGIPFCEEFRYYEVFYVQPAPECVCSTGQCQCMSGPV